jgi:tryptophan synthase alpha chain
MDRKSINAIKNICRIAGGKCNIAVGFGISRPYHVAEVIRAGANAVIIGSALIDKISESRSIDDMERSLRLFAASMKKECVSQLRTK